MHNLFGWSYPPGCNGPPDYPDPHPASIEIYDILECAGLGQEIIDKVCKIVDELAIQIDVECPVCLERAYKEGNL